MGKRLFPKLYGLLSLLIALSIAFSSPVASQNRSLGDLLQRGVQVIQLSTLSDAQEVQFGKQINQEIISSERFTLATNPDLKAYINKIGQRLAQVSDRPQIPYTFQVIADDNINAFAIMGGFIYINTGLIRAAANESELASVIAHEIGHVVARHSLEQIKKAALTQGLLEAARIDRKTWVQLGVEIAYRLPQSRKAELEADQLGLNNLKRAGYAPIGMITFMEKLMQKAEPPAIFSTHPPTKNRLAVLQESVNPQTARKGDGLNEIAYRRKIRALLS